MLSPKVQRLFAVGRGALPEHCIIDIGAIDRWIHERNASDGLTVWQDIVNATRASSRTFYWISTLPGRPSQLFGASELAQTLVALKGMGVPTIIQSREGLGEMLASDTSLKLPERVAVIGAQIEDCPEQLFVLNGQVEAVLDVETGVVHSYWTQHRDGRGEPFLIPFLQAAALPDPADSRRRSPGGNAVGRYLEALEGQLLHDQDIIARTGSVPSYVIDSLLKKSERIAERAEELKGTAAGADVVARSALQQLLPALASLSGAVPGPTVIVPVETGSSGALRLASSAAFALLGSGKPVKMTSEPAIKRMLGDLSGAYPKLWIAPRALDLLGYMHDNGIALPEKVVDPAVCAFALNPDDIVREIDACPSAQHLPAPVAEWLWDVKRKAPPPRELEALAVSLPDIVRELRLRTGRCRLDALIDDDLAATLPVLAAMERRGARVRHNTAGAWVQIQGAMTALEAQFRSIIGDVDPYEAGPEALLRAVSRHGVAFSKGYVLPGGDAKNRLERLAHHDQRVSALLEARTASEVQEWLKRLGKGGERFRGRHIPLATGRWGMNGWPLQAMPKHSTSAKALRRCIEGPRGRQLLAADFSSFEVRLVAGLSRDPVLLAAAQQPDAIGYLTDKYFGAKFTPSDRATMKQYIHPVSYGIEEWGFVHDQVGVPVSRARNDYGDLRLTLSGIFAWQSRAIAVARAKGFVQTRGGWRREPASIRRMRSQSVERAIVSTLVQGLAADILRWCLRELHRTLPGMGAELIFQNHDELYVEVDDATLSEVRAEVKDVLEQRVQQSGLVPPGVTLVTKLKEGATWADLA